MTASTGNVTALREAGPATSTSLSQAAARPVLSARGLGKSFGGFYAVKNVDLDVEHARVHALIGPNGAGKTTVFNLLTKFLQPTSGEITLLGETITKTDPAKVARM
ncbi:ATP-binding cassette domain-containing protein, partial [Ochrobactrum soli]